MNSTITEEKVAQGNTKEIRHDSARFEQQLEPILNCIAGFGSIGLFDRYRKLFAAYSSLIEWTNCGSYDFVLALTKLEEKYGDELLDTSNEILDKILFEPSVVGMQNGESNLDVAFAAFYYIALTYNRYSKKDELKEHLQKYYACFVKKYPLTYELLGRYCTHNHDYQHTLIFASIATDGLKALGQENIALGVTYASATCEIAEYCFLNRKICRGSGGSDFTFAHDTAMAKHPEGENLIALALKSVGAYQYNWTDLDDGKIEIALDKIERVIQFNPRYPKYHFLKAKLLFFQALYERNKVTQEECDEVRALIKKAIDCLKPENKNYESLRWQYERMDNIVEQCPKNSKQWYEAEGFLFEAAKNNIIRATDSKHVQPNFYKRSSNAPHVFVSYSSHDFKAVYCDIIEFQRNGILCDYDNDMNSFDRAADDRTKQKWYTAVEYKIRSADCILCYLSEHYASSAAILLELKLIEKYKKPVIAIDLRGDHIISRLFVRMAQDETLSNSITSDAMYWFAKKFEDDNNVIVRAKDPMLANHIPQVKSRLYYLCPEVVSMIVGEALEWEGVNTGHSMEDHCFQDKDHKVYAVADGITRQNRDEYAFKANKTESIALKVSRLFCERFKELVVNDFFMDKLDENIEESMKRAFRLANADVKRIADEYMYENTLDDRVVEKPGCVVITAVVRNDMLYFGAVGDCMGILVRNDQKIIFSGKQTMFAFSKAGRELSRADLIRDYINNPKNAYGYGVVNGDRDAQEFFRVSHLSLEYGDSVYLVSDGVSDYIECCDPKEYNDLTLKKILENAAKLNQKIKGEGASLDDMAIVRIKWTCDRAEIERLASE